VPKLSSAPPTAAPEPSCLAIQAATHIRLGIAQGIYHDRLLLPPVRTLAQELALSTATIHEALTILAEQWLVVRDGHELRPHFPQPTAANRDERARLEGPARGARWSRAVAHRSVTSAVITDDLIHPRLVHLGQLHLEVLRATSRGVIDSAVCGVDSRPLAEWRAKEVINDLKLIMTGRTDTPRSRLAHLGCAWRLIPLQLDPGPPMALPDDEDCLLRARAAGLFPTTYAQLVGISSHTLGNVSDRLHHRLRARNAVHSVRRAYECKLLLPYPGSVQ
jgi:hypothetical protein